MNDFDRYAPAMTLFFAALCLIPLGFGIVVITGGSPIPKDLYGEIVFAVPALVWVAAQLAVSVLAASASAFRWPVMACVGQLMVACVMVFFSAMAIMVGANGTILVFGAGFVAAVASVSSAVAWRGRHGARR